MEVYSTDWKDVWKEQQRQHQETTRNSTDASFWDANDAARRFYRMAQENNGERIERTTRGLPLTPQSRVLDVRAGSGALAIPIARQVRHVTAVEPSKGMWSVLAKDVPTLPLLYFTSYDAWRISTFNGWMNMPDHHVRTHSKLSFLVREGIAAQR